MAIRIMTDSSSDITQREAKELDITVVPMNVVIDGKTYRDGIDIMNRTFYERLSTAKTLPSTSQPAPGALVSFFEEAKQAGDEVIGIFISSALSGTILSVELAREVVAYDKITIIEGFAASSALRALVEYAALLRDGGLDAAGIVKRIEEAKEKIIIMGAADDLKYLYKGGRLSKTVAVAGSMLNIKPMFHFTQDGIQMCGKVRGANGVINFFIEQIERVPPMIGAQIYLGYAYIKEACKDILKKLAERGYNVRICPIGSVIGVHTGPGAVILSYIRA